ncbi:hypothetical protein GYMLUDRAFT_220458 [Collybiopsis luxurians FD-317 M1]|nr:hypothetical protein GYMLUDRAFT_220458 [Collybiopsis luxurians FD-317 M1]
MAENLLALSGLIADSVAKIDARCHSLNTQFPNINECAPAIPSHIRQDPEVSEAAAVAVAAAAQLVANVRMPASTLMDHAQMFLLSAALGAASTFNFAEIIREIQPQGCHADEISRKCGVDSSKISRILRALSTHHIFREITPDVFTNNAISCLLDSGKSTDDLINFRGNKFSQGSRGFSALVELSTDETFKSAAYLSESLQRSLYSSHDQSPPFKTAFKTDLDIFTWYELPENSTRFKRFSAAMNAAAHMAPSAATQECAGFDWKSLTSGSLIVDVGGGLGHIVLFIMKMFPGLQGVVQDKPGVLDDAKKFWEKEFPKAIEAGSITFQVHDFLGPQPVKDADVFLLRLILHNHPDNVVLKILKHLREAAQNSTVLIIMDCIVPFACKEDSGISISNSNAKDAPHPLLPNYGLSGSFVYNFDLQACVILIFTGQERTLRHFNKLLLETGWCVNQIHHPPGTHLRHIVAKVA